MQVKKKNTVATATASFAPTKPVSTGVTVAEPDTGARMLIKVKMPRRIAMRKKCINYSSYLFILTKLTLLKTHVFIFFCAKQPYYLVLNLLALLFGQWLKMIIIASTPVG